MRNTIQNLLNSNESAYSISKEVKVDPSTIQRLRSGDRKLDNITLKVAEELYNYAKKQGY